MLTNFGYDSTSTPQARVSVATEQVSRLGWVSERVMRKIR